MHDQSRIAQSQLVNFFNCSTRGKNDSFVYSFFLQFLIRKHVVSGRGPGFFALQLAHSHLIIYDSYLLSNGLFGILHINSCAVR